MVLTELAPRPGEWVDTNKVRILLSQTENMARLRDLMEALTEGISNRILPVREDYAPAWLKRIGVEVGGTPMGDRILGPLAKTHPGSRPDLPACWQDHVERFERNGLSAASAQMQAWQLVHEIGHASLCSVCPVLSPDQLLARKVMGEDE